MFWAVALLLVTACQSLPEATPSLALACQVRACRCDAETTELFKKRKTTEVLWRLNGDAYCPEGYVLRLSDEK